MILFSTFGFKGTILPVLDKNDKIYLFIKNELDHRVLLNIVNDHLNKFVNIEKNSTKLFFSGYYRSNLQLKVFYLGQELFDFNCAEIDKNSLLLYSNYIIKNTVDIDRVSFSPLFTDGLKLVSLSNKPQTLFIQILNNDTNEIVFEDNFLSGEPYIFKRDFFTNYGIIVLNSNGQKIYEYKLNLTNQKVLIKFESSSLGDTLAWIPYVEEFRKKHKCEIICKTYWNSLFTNQYPFIKFVSPQTSIDQSEILASYKIKCEIPPRDPDSLFDYRNLSLQEMASKTLGLDYVEIKPKVFSDESPSDIDGDYVVIATSSTSKAKLWNREGGWQETIDYLNKIGLKVVLIQKEKENGYKNVINKSGTSNINDTIRIIKNSKFFIGLSSGLSWLAWSLNKKVILISGFTDPKVEFKSDCYRVINTSVCNSCWNDKKYLFDRTNWFWCPRNKNFECSKEITPFQVINKIEEVVNIT